MDVSLVGAGLQAAAPVGLPSVFVSHGSPMFALEPGLTGPALRQLGQTLEAQCAVPLRAVLVISAHWMAPTVEVMLHPQPSTWHDFGGFPPALYRLQYPAPGAPELGQQVLQCLAQAGVPARGDEGRPFDHGAWVPLMHLLPQAQVPVLQLALPMGAGPAEVYAVGQALSGLRQQGVLLLGSGSMTHNLREFFTLQPPHAAAPATYVQDFSRWVESMLVTHNLDMLLHYRDHAPWAARAHPTDEHFLPLFFALGAANWGGAARPRVEYLSREVVHGYLAMDALALY